MKSTILFVASTLLLFGCSNDSHTDIAVPSKYLDNTGRDDVLGGGVKMIQVDTPKGLYRVWTKRVGNNPT
jgi:proline iminopeptidase